jgi:hypothetical protein
MGDVRVAAESAGQQVEPVRDNSRTVWRNRKGETESVGGAGSVRGTANLQSAYDHQEVTHVQ